MLRMVENPQGFPNLQRRPGQFWVPKKGVLNKTHIQFAGTATGGMLPRNRMLLF